jgi:hypothetical protein
LKNWHTDLHKALFILYTVFGSNKKMAKIVFNNCYGGFSVSDAAMDRMVELGWNLKLNPKYKPNSKSVFSGKYLCMGYVDCPRHHPILIQVVEELGKKANGVDANLEIVEVESLYRIEEYDGSESVVTPDGSDWEYADNTDYSWTPEGA